MTDQELRDQGYDPDRAWRGRKTDPPLIGDAPTREHALTISGRFHAPGCLGLSRGEHTSGQVGAAFRRIQGADIDEALAKRAAKREGAAA